MTNVYDPQIHYRTPGGWVDVGTGAFTPVVYPNDTNVGIAALDGWEPDVTMGAPDDLVGIQFAEPGGVLEDTRIYGSLLITGPHITVRRCEIIDGTIDNTYGNQVGNDCLIEDTTVRLSEPGVNTDFTLGFPAIGNAGLMLRRCAVLDTTEGPRTGGTNLPLRDPDVSDGYHVRIYNTYIRITGPHPCSPVQGDEYHGDGIQCFDGGLGGTPLTIRNCTIRSVDQQTTPPNPTNPASCAGTSCMIAGLNQSQAMDVDRLLMSGALFSFVVECGGSFRNLYFEAGSNPPSIPPGVWGPISVPPVAWAITDEDAWSALLCTLDVNGQPDEITASIPHGWQTGPFDPPP